MDDRRPGSGSQARARCKKCTSGAPAAVRSANWCASDHDWLEVPGPVRYLVRLIDDATSWSWGRFVESDSTHFNMAVLWEYLNKHGRIVDVYTDRASMFTVPIRASENAGQPANADRVTQLGRALRELGIGSILALSPQAKVRVERSFLTARDRLVKQLRLAKITTLASANVSLESDYWPSSLFGVGKDWRGQGGHSVLGDVGKDGISKG